MLLPENRHEERMGGKSIRQRDFRVGAVVVGDAALACRRQPAVAGDFQCERHRVVAGVDDHHGKGAVCTLRGGGIRFGAGPVARNPHRSAALAQLVEGRERIIRLVRLVGERIEKGAVTFTEN